MKKIFVVILVFMSFILGSSWPKNKSTRMNMLVSQKMTIAPATGFTYTFPITLE